MSELDERVCPRCGQLAAEQRFCKSCGLNLAAQSEVPTRSEWEAAQTRSQATPSSAKPSDATPPTTTSRRTFDPFLVMLSNVDYGIREGLGKLRVYYHQHSKAGRLAFVVSTASALALVLVVVVALAARGEGASSSGGGGSSSTATETTQAASAPTYRYAACQTTDSAWLATSAALGQADGGASYAQAAASDAGALAGDLQQLESEANSANETSAATIYFDASQLFHGDAEMLPLTGLVPPDTCGFIPSARTQLQADCSLTW